MTEPSVFDGEDMPSLGDVIIIDGIEHHVYSAHRMHYVEPAGDHRVIEFTTRASTKRPEGE